MLLERLILTTMERRGKEKKYQQIGIEVRGFERLQNRYEERKTETLEESVSRSTGVGTSVFFERCQEKLEFLFSYYLVDKFSSTQKLSHVHLRIYLACNEQSLVHFQNSVENTVYIPFYVMFT